MVEKIRSRIGLHANICYHKATSVSGSGEELTSEYGNAQAVDSLV